tara:strand:+ start:290 stop:490 length:201 start_codon:yes stop_codon:yes gene_type:complete
VVLVEEVVLVHLHLSLEAREQQIKDMLEVLVEQVPLLVEKLEVEVALVLLENHPLQLAMDQVVMVG